ncbi:PrgI family protein [Candidatus Saccharibacteria bacterium]|nr:PrgI family protein [Candidatus Saccharibacteria bacterium]
MAQYKVPQDVEADDKLLGPFTFRQFVYLMIMGGFIGVAFALFNIFPLFALLAVPFIIFFAVLALPIKKDQPMETYLAAVISFHLKPNKRFWVPGQRESTIEITAPKKVDTPRAREITQEEAGNRLSFLANVVDTEGYAVKGDINNAPMRAQFLAEANNAPDILDTSSSPIINQMLAKQQNSRHQELVQQMRQVIKNTEEASGENSYFSTAQAINPAAMAPQPTRYPYNQQTYQPIAPNPTQPVNPNVQSQLRNLANNTEYSVETISKEANRIEHQNI